MKYLENNICEFKPLFNINYSQKKDIISCSFFKMLNSGYKDFNIYIKGLINLYNYVEHLNTKGYKYHLRIFIDSSIYEDKYIMDKIKNLQKLEIVVYSCPSYQESSNSKYHVGLFGTLVRFFPMFDFPNNDARYVIISDIDDIVIKTTNIAIKEMQKANQIDLVYLLKIGNLGKNVKYNYPSLYKDVITIYSISQSIVSFKRFDSKIITEFITKTNTTEKYLSYYYEIQKKHLNKELEKKYKNVEPYIYGIDEYFINKILTEYMIDNKIPTAINFFWNLYSPIYYLLEYLDFIDKKNIKKLDNLLNYILTKHNLKFNSSDSIEKKYDIIDKIIYNKSSTNLSYELNKTLYTIFIKNKIKFLFPKDFRTILFSKQFYLTYEFDIIKYNFCPGYKDLMLHVRKFNIEDKESFDKLSK
jgi:hypothetical protein